MQIKMSFLRRDPCTHNDLQTPFFSYYITGIIVHTDASWGVFVFVCVLREREKEHALLWRGWGSGRQKERERERILGTTLRSTT